MDGKFEARPVSLQCILVLSAHVTHRCQIMYLALTYDHRLLDGREAVTFLVKVSYLMLFRVVHSVGFEHHLTET